MGTPSENDDAVRWILIGDGDMRPEELSTVALSGIVALSRKGRAALVDDAASWKEVAPAVRIRPPESATMWRRGGAEEMRTATVGARQRRLTPACSTSRFSRAGSVGAVSERQSASCRRRIGQAGLCTCLAAWLGA